MDVPQVSLKLVFRGEELPRLHSISFISGPNTCVAEAPQDRDLAKPVAVALLLFRRYSAFREMTLFRIRTAKMAGFIDTILNAKKQSQGKNPICSLANGAFLKLFLSLSLYDFNNPNFAKFYTTKTQQIYTRVILLQRATLITRNTLI